MSGLIGFPGQAASVQYTVESSGALTAAQAGPTYTLYRNGTVVVTTGGSPEVTLTGANPATGLYRVSFTMPSGWAANDVVELFAATGTTGSAFVGRWVLLPANLQALVVNSSGHIGTVATLTGHTPQTGDSYALVGPGGSGLTAIGDTRLGNLDASVSSRLSSAGYTAPPSAASNATAVRSELTTELARIDVATSTRLASASYSAAPSASTVASQVRTELTTELGRIDAAVSSRLSTAGYTAPLDASGVRTAVGLASANLDTQFDTLPTAAETATAVWAAGTRTLTSSGSGIGAEEIADIVDGISAALTAPGFAASVSILEGTYATVADVETRLSAYGVTNAADLIDPDGTRDSSELDLVTVAIEYANSIIDEHIVDLLHNTSHRVQSTFTRPSGNAWLRDRCVDIACYRIATLGGRTTSDVLRLDYETAIDRLQKARNQQIRIPNLEYTAPTRPYAMEMGGSPTVVRTRGA